MKNAFLIFTLTAVFSLNAFAKDHPEAKAVANIINNDSEILDCYLASEAGNHKQPDTFVVSFKLTKAGYPQKVKAARHPAQTKDPEFKKCVVRTVRKMRFPAQAKTKAKGDITASLKFP